MQNFGLIREGKSNPVLKSIPVPKLRDDHILVRTVAVALNPTDWTTIDEEGADDTLMGVEFAGIVEEVGKAVTKSFKKGDRIAGTGHGANDLNPQTGTFAKYITVKGDLQLHIPDAVSFEKATTLGSGISSAAYALYRILGLPVPGSKIAETGQPILIYGGSTATGTIGIQLAKLSGRKVLTTASPKHFDMLKQRGADEVYDYRDPKVGELIKKDTADDLTTVFDTVAVESTAAITAKAIGRNGGRNCTLLPLESYSRTDVETIFFLGYDMFGDEYMFEGGKYPAKPDEYQWAVEWAATAEKLWHEGKLKTHPERIREGGLHGAITGMQEMREGRGPSGEKWVYRVDETTWPQA